MKKLDQKTIEKAARLTKKELDFINEISEMAFMKEHRPLVYLALCSSLIGNVVFQSEGVLTNQACIDLVAGGIETYE